MGNAAPYRMEVHVSGFLRTVGTVAAVVGAVALTASTLGLGGAAAAATLKTIGTYAALAGTAASPAAETTHKLKRPETMTALSLFADSRAAYLVTDGATFNAVTGQVVSLGPKVCMVSDARIAIAVQGWGCPIGIANSLGITCQPEPKDGTQAEILRMMPTALAHMRANASFPLLHHTRLWVALWDRDRRQPAMFTVQSGAMPDGDGVPFRLERTDGQISGLSEAQVAEAVPGGWPTQPVRDGVSILRAQRIAPIAAIGGRLGVGGECGVYTVNRRGVTYQPLMRFDDRIGQPIDPSIVGIQA